MKSQDDPIEDGSEIQQAETGGRSRWIALLPIAIAVVWFGLDLLAKQWALATLNEGVAVPVLGDFLKWMLVKNPGAAFSFASGATWVFTLLSAVVAGVIIWNIKRIRSVLWAIVLGLVLGGTLGNLADRLFREPGFPLGHVIDFIYTPWMMPAIYNVADIGIVVGMVCFVLLTLFGVSIDGARRTSKK